VNNWNKAPLTAAKYVLMLEAAERGDLTQDDLQRQAEYAKRDALRLPAADRPSFFEGVTNICTDIFEINKDNGGDESLVVPTF
jgi:pantothenate synthetase